MITDEMLWYRPERKASIGLEFLDEDEDDEEQLFGQIEKY